MKLQKTDENLHQIASLVHSAFKKIKDPASDSLFLSRYQHSENYGILNKEKLVNYMMINIFNSRVFRKRTKMAGIGYVSSLRQARGKGNSKKLMREVLTNLHDEGIPYANIASFSERLYRKFGFENTIYKKKYIFDRHALNFLQKPTDGKYREGTWKDLLVQNGAAQLYEVPLHSTHERNTMNRPFWWWNRIDQSFPHRHLVVYFGRVGLPQAYMFYRLKRGTCYVDELYGDQSDGIRGLLNYLAKKIVALRFEITMPEESKLEDYFADQSQLKISLHPFMMTRIIDIEKVIKCMKLIRHGNAIIQVTNDKSCPWNNGSWQLTDDKDGYRVKKISAKPDFSGSINNWTKVLLGDLTLEQAIKMGEISGSKHHRLEFEKGTVTFFDNI